MEDSSSGKVDLKLKLKRKEKKDKEDDKLAKVGEHKENLESKDKDEAMHDPDQKLIEKAKEEIASEAKNPKPMTITKALEPLYVAEPLVDPLKVVTQAVKINKESGDVTYSQVDEKLLATASHDFRLVTTETSEGVPFSSQVVRSAQPLHPVYTKPKNFRVVVPIERNAEVVSYIDYPTPDSEFYIDRDKHLYFKIFVSLISQMGIPRVDDLKEVMMFNIQVPDREAMPTIWKVFDANSQIIGPSLNAAFNTYISQRVLLNNSLVKIKSFPVELNIYNDVNLAYNAWIQQFLPAQINAAVVANRFNSAIQGYAVSAAYTPDTLHPYITQFPIRILPMFHAFYEYSPPFISFFTAEVKQLIRATLVFESITSTTAVLDLRRAASMTNTQSSQLGAFFSSGLMGDPRNALINILSGVVARTTMSFTPGVGFGARVPMSAAIMAMCVKMIVPFWMISNPYMLSDIIVAYFKKLSFSANSGLGTGILTTTQAALAGAVNASLFDQHVFALAIFWPDDMRNRRAVDSTCGDLDTQDIQYIEAPPPGIALGTTGDPIFDAWLVRADQLVPIHTIRFFDAALAHGSMSMADERDRLVKVMIQLATGANDARLLISQWLNSFSGHPFVSWRSRAALQANNPQGYVPTARFVSAGDTTLPLVDFSSLVGRIVTPDLTLVAKSPDLWLRPYLLQAQLTEYQAIFSTLYQHFTGNGVLVPTVTRKVLVGMAASFMPESTAKFIIEMTGSRVQHMPIILAGNDYDVLYAGIMNIVTASNILRDHYISALRWSIPTTSNPPNIGNMLMTTSELPQGAALTVLPNLLNMTAVAYLAYFTRQVVNGQIVGPDPISYTANYKLNIIEKHDQLHFDGLYTEKLFNDVSHSLKSFNITLFSSADVLPEYISRAVLEYPMVSLVPELEHGSTVKDLVVVDLPNIPNQLAARMDVVIGEPYIYIVLPQVQKLYGPVLGLSSPYVVSMEYNRPIYKTL